MPQLYTIRTYFHNGSQLDSLDAHPFAVAKVAVDSLRRCGNPEYVFSVVMVPHTPTPTPLPTETMNTPPSATTLSALTLALSLVHNTHARGGHTEYLTPTRGRYIVGDGDRGFTVPVLDPSDTDLVGDLSTLILYWVSLGYTTVGGWVDTETGITYFDPGNAVADEGGAYQLAAQRGEIAYWDNLDACEVRL